MDTIEQLAPLEDASTVVLLRDGDAGLETLLLERPRSSSSFSGAWVFPGGKVDPQDRVDGIGTPLDELAAAQAAGLRELAEETGQQLSPEALVWLAQWTPMQRLPRRFRTWFMLAPAASRTIVLNPAEHEHFAWLTPAQALARHAAGEMKLVPPTWVTLHHLSGQATVAQALAEARGTHPFAFKTHLLLPKAAAPQDGAGAAEPHAPEVRPAGVLWAGDEAYPAGPEIPAVPPGSRHRLTTSELPWRYERTER